MSANPRLRDGLAFVPVPDGYVVEGGPVRRQLTGPLAAEKLPDLLPLLDGSQPLEQIAAMVDPAALRVLGLLLREDLVRFEDASEPHPMRTFLHRSQNAWAAERAWRALQAARVTVVGGQEIADLVADLLVESGVGTVQRRGPADVTIDLTGLTDADAADWGVLAGNEVGRAIRRLTGPLVATPPSAPATRRHLTEPRIPLGRSPYARVRTLAWILAGRSRTPRVGPPGAVRTYLMGDLTGEGAGVYAVDDSSGTLARLPGTAPVAGDIVTVVLTADSPATRRHEADVGHTIAQIAGDAHAAGWSAIVRATHGFEEPLELDSEHEQAITAMDLTPVREVSHPRRQNRGRATTDPRLPTERALARARELWPGKPSHHAWHSLDAHSWVAGYAAACGLVPKALLVFEADATTGSDPRATVQAAMTAETVRRFAKRSGMRCVLLPDLGTYDARAVYGCAFGEAAGIPADAVW